VLRDLLSEVRRERYGPMLESNLGRSVELCGNQTTCINVFATLFDSNNQLARGRGQRLSSHDACESAADILFIGYVISEVHDAQVLILDLTQCHFRL